MGKDKYNSLKDNLDPEDEGFVKPRSEYTILKEKSGEVGEISRVNPLSYLVNLPKFAKKGEFKKVLDNAKDFEEIVSNYGSHGRAGEQKDKLFRSMSKRLGRISKVAEKYNKVDLSDFELKDIKNLIKYINNFKENHGDGEGGGLEKVAKISSILFILGGLFLGIGAITGNIVAQGNSSSFISGGAILFALGVFGSFISFRK